MAAHQAPPSLGFSRQQHWSGLLFPSPMHESEKWKWKRSHVRPSATPWTAAFHAPPSMGFSRQEYWSGVPLTSHILCSNYCEEGWVPKNWCFWTVVLEKTLKSPLDCKEIQQVHSKGDQPWDFFGRNDAKAEAPVLWPLHAKSWLMGKDSDAGRDWGQ